MEIQEIIQTVKAAGVSGLLIFALIGGFRQWWVFGWVHKGVVQERDEWKALALHGTALSERSVQVAKTAAEGQAPTSEVGS